MIFSISPTCSWAAVELSSACSPSDRAVDWQARFCIVHAGGAGWPWFAMNRGGVSADANWIRGSWARRDDLPVVV